MAAIRILHVDDEPDIRKVVQLSLGLDPDFSVRSCASGTDALAVTADWSPDLVLLDVMMPDMDGPTTLTRLRERPATVEVPIVFMTGHGDIPMTVRAMKAGAVEFLTKPFRDQDIVDAVRIAIERNREQRGQEKSLSRLRTSYNLLTPREKEVIVLVASGMMNKQVAAHMDISEITVKVHRGNVMRKMGAQSLAELVRMVDALGIQS